MFKDVPATLPIAPYGIIVLLGKTNTGLSGKCPYCHTFIWYATVPVEGREKVRRDSIVATCSMTGLGEE